MSLNYDLLGETILLFWDEKSNFEKIQTQQKIMEELFQEVVLIENLARIKEVLGSCVNEEQKFLLLVHLNHSKNNQGFDSYKESKIEKEYPDIRNYFISSVPKKQIHEAGHDSFDVFSYDNFHDKIGTQFIPQKKKEIMGNTNTQVENNKFGIFLSHSSTDSDIVEKFRDIILHGGLNFNLDDVKFTSEEDYGIAGGVNIPEDLKEFLNNKMGLFIQFMTPSYKKSRVCLNEEGVGWCIMDEKMFIPILIPPSRSEDLSWVKTVNKGIKIDNKESLLNIYQNRKDFFGDVDVTRLTKKIEEFVEYYTSTKK